MILAFLGAGNVGCVQSKSPLADLKTATEFKVSRAMGLHTSEIGTREGEPEGTTSS
jgi:hypothetical protein